MAPKTQAVLLGEVLRKHRLERDLSQEKLAEAAGIHRTHISFIERGEQRPSFEYVWRIARAPGAPFVDLVAEIDRACQRAHS